MCLSLSTNTVAGLFSLENTLNKWACLYEMLRQPIVNHLWLSHTERGTKARTFTTTQKGFSLAASSLASEVFAWPIPSTQQSSEGDKSVYSQLFCMFHPPSWWSVNLVQPRNMTDLQGDKIVSPPPPFASKTWATAIKSKVEGCLCILRRKRSWRFIQGHAKFAVKVGLLCVKSATNRITWKQAFGWLYARRNKFYDLKCIPYIVQRRKYKTFWYLGYYISLNYMSPCKTDTVLASQISLHFI